MVALHGVVGVAAVAAGQALARDPTGAALGLPQAWLEGSPFADYRVPGLFLATVIGSTNLLSAFWLWRRSPFGAAASLGTGLLLAAWITIETLIIGLRHWSQGFWAALFALMVLLAWRQFREER